MGIGIRVSLFMCLSGRAFVSPHASIRIFAATRLGKPQFFTAQLNPGMEAGPQIVLLFKRPQRRSPNLSKLPTNSS